VYDGQGLGGIYEGPIGIMTASDAKVYRDRHHSDQNFWEYLYYKFIDN
jgi:hypothetical protein